MKLLQTVLMKAVLDAGMGHVFQIYINVMEKLIVQTTILMRLSVVRFINLKLYI